MLSNKQNYQKERNSRPSIDKKRTKFLHSPSLNSSIGKTGTFKRAKNKGFNPTEKHIELLRDRNQTIMQREEIFNKMFIG